MMRNDKRVDFLGLAQVLRTMNEMRQPSKLDLMDREYELRGREKLLQNKWSTANSMLDSNTKIFDNLLDDRDKLEEDLDGMNVNIKKLSHRKRSQDDGKNINALLTDSYGVSLKAVNAQIEKLKAASTQIAEDNKDLTLLANQANAGKDFYETLRMNDVGGVDDEGFSVFDENKDRIISTPEREAALASLLKNFDQAGLTDTRGVSEGFWSAHKEDEVQSRVRTSERQAEVDKNKAIKNSPEYIANKEIQDENDRIQKQFDKTQNIKRTLGEFRDSGLTMADDPDERLDKENLDYNTQMRVLNRMPDNRDAELEPATYWKKSLFDVIANPEYQQLNPFDKSPAKINNEFVAQGLTEEWYTEMYEATEKMAEESGDNSAWDIKKFIDNSILAWDVRSTQQKQQIYDLKNYWDKEIKEGRMPTFKGFVK